MNRRVIVGDPVVASGPPPGQGRAASFGGGGCYLRVALAFCDGVGEGLLGGDVVEQRRLDRLEDDRVDVGLVGDRRDDVRVGRDDVLGQRPGAVLDGRRRRPRRTDRRTTRASTGRSATCLLKSVIDRGLVKNWASAMEAFGNLVSPLTEIDIRPLPVTLDLPSGAGTMRQVVVQRGVLVLDRRGPGWGRRVERRVAGGEGVEADAVVGGGQDRLVDGAGLDHVDVHLEPRDRLGRVERERLAVIAEDLDVALVDHLGEQVVDREPDVAQGAGLVEDRLAQGGQAVDASSGSHRPRRRPCRRWPC